jgi:hypothetical protein
MNMRVYCTCKQFMYFKKKGKSGEGGVALSIHSDFDCCDCYCLSICHATVPVSKCSDGKLMFIINEL